MKYLLYINGEITGPFTPEDLLLQSSFSFISLVCPENYSGEDENDWQCAESFEELTDILNQDDSIKKEIISSRSPEWKSSEDKTVKFFERSKTGISDEETVSSNEDDMSVYLKESGISEKTVNELTNLNVKRSKTISSLDTKAPESEKKILSAQMESEISKTKSFKLVRELEDNLKETELKIRNQLDGIKQLRNIYGAGVLFRHKNKHSESVQDDDISLKIPRCLGSVEPSWIEEMKKDEIFQELANTSDYFLTETEEVSDEDKIRKDIGIERKQIDKQKEKASFDFRDTKIQIPSEITLSSDFIGEITKAVAAEKTQTEEIKETVQEFATETTLPREDDKQAESELYKEKEEITEDINHEISQEKAKAQTVEISITKPLSIAEDETGISSEDSEEEIKVKEDLIKTSLTEQKPVLTISEADSIGLTNTYKQLGKNALPETELIPKHEVEKQGVSKQETKQDSMSKPPVTTEVVKRRADKAEVTIPHEKVPVTDAKKIPLPGKETIHVAKALQNEAKPTLSPAATKAKKSRDNSRLIMLAVMAGLVFVAGGIIYLFLSESKKSSEVSTEPVTQKYMKTFSSDTSAIQNAKVQQDIAIVDGQEDKTFEQITTTDRSDENQMQIESPISASEKIARAVQIVKQYQLGGGKGNIEQWFSNAFVSGAGQGFQKDWSATFLHDNAYVVQYRLLRPRKEPVTYQFEVNIKTAEIVRGINNSAIELLGAVSRSQQKDFTKAEKEISDISPVKVKKTEELAENLDEDFSEDSSLFEDESDMFPQLELPPDPHKKNGRKSRYIDKMLYRKSLEDKLAAEDELLP